MTRCLTIVSVAYPFAPVTADPAGGAEQVLAQLDRRLVAAGHRSIVVAAQGSVVAGDLIEVPVPSGEIDDRVRATIHAHMHAAVAAVTPACDLVHLHGLDFGAYLPPPGPPALVTLHMPLAWYSPDALGTGRLRTFYQPVSTDQASRAPAGIDLLPPIANGVDVRAYRPGLAKDPYVLVLGRVAPEKGFHDALHAAKLANVPLCAAGHVFPYAEHRRYFAQEVAPLFSNTSLWLGPVAGRAKQRLLREARCLLLPSTAPETSSLVAMEALASGTPVIAYRSGALPDIVEDGVTGFLVDGVEAMAAAIGRIGTIDPAACRRSACRRFALNRTAREYLSLYEELAT